MTDAPLGKAAETGINRYAENRSETVKIEVPDDGTLRVVKSVEAIDTVLKKLGVKQSSEQNVRVPTILDKTEQWMILETPFGPAITDTKQLLPIDKEVYERLREGKARAAGYKGEVRDRGRGLYDEISALVSGNVEPLSVDRRVGSHLHRDELEAVVFKRGPEDEIHIAAKAFDHFVKQGAVKFESANGQVVIAKDGAGTILGVVSPYTYEAVSEGFGWTKQSEAEPTAPPLTTSPASGVQGTPKQPLSIEEMERKMADAVDAFIEEATPPAGLSVKVVQSSAPPKRPSGKSQYAFQDEEIEQRWQAARGVPKTGAIAKMIEWGHRLYNQANREFEHLPRTPRNEGIRFHLLKLQKQRGVVGDKTIRIQQGITVIVAGGRRPVYSQGDSGRPRKRSGARTQPALRVHPKGSSDRESPYRRVRVEQQEGQNGARQTTRGMVGNTRSLQDLGQDYRLECWRQTRQRRLLQAPSARIRRCSLQVRHGPKSQNAFRAVLLAQTHGQRQRHQHELRASRIRSHGRDASRH